MKRATLILATLVFFFGVRSANADVIAGPNFANPSIGGDDTSWGIQFTALDNSTLTSFDYTHRTAEFGNPFSGTITLMDTTTSTVVYSTPYSPLAATGNPALSVLSLSGLNIPLKAGDMYQLVATSDIQSGANDEVYQYGVLDTPPFAYPVSDTDISVTQGVFNNNPGFQEAAAWGAFTNLTTAPAAAAAVPEPSSLALLALGGLAVAGWRRWKGRHSSARK